MIGNREIDRRWFLKGGLIVAAGIGLGPRFLLRAAGAQSGGRRVLVVVFQRGAVDGLNMVIPYQEQTYWDRRPLLAIPPPGSGEGAALDLDGQFAFHPSMSGLHRAFRGGELAVVHASGSHDPTRSHFDAQDFMETGVPGNKAVADGWLNRYLQVVPGEGSVFRGTALGGGTPRALMGPAEVLAAGGLAELRIGGGRQGRIARGALERMYGPRDDRLGDAVRSALAAVDIAESLDPDAPPDNGARYPASPLGEHLREIALLVKADVGLEIAFTDIGGWDTHRSQGRLQGQLPGLLGDLSQSLTAFRTDLGSRFADVCVVTMSEFGRTVAENGTGGTDHGHGNAMLLHGGTVNGGRVFGDWPGLEPANLYEGRDLAITTDFRTILAEVVDRHLGHRGLDTVFPGFEYDPGSHLGLIA